MTRRRGFTILELVAVILVIALLAVTALPAFDSLRESRRAAASDELARTLAAARAHAMTTGRTTGLFVDSSGGAIGVATELRYIPDPAAGPASLTELDSATRAASFGQTVITAADLPSADDTIWFGHDGTPRLRTPAGDAGAASAPAVITLSGDHTVTVLPITGAIERAMP